MEDFAEQMSAVAHYLRTGKHLPGKSRSQHKTTLNQSNTHILRDGVLYYIGAKGGHRQRREVITSVERAKEIVRHCHSDPTGHHLGRESTLKKISMYYWWKGMARDVSTFISNCETCQGPEKPKTQAPELKQILGMDPLESELVQVGMDVIRAMEGGSDHGQPDAPPVGFEHTYHTLSPDKMKRKVGDPVQTCQKKPRLIQKGKKVWSRRRSMGKSSHRQKLIIDVDTGIDDAHAIILALSSPSVEVVAITCANGNVKIDDVTDNTLRVLQVCDRMDIPVYKGAARSLLGKVSEYENFKSPAWSAPVDNSTLRSEHAANALVRLTKRYPDQITLVSLAPLTNIALALSLDPDFPERLRDVVIMGGSTDGRGRVSPCAEFNFFNDPEAAHVVLNSMQKIRILPFDTCCQNYLPWDFMEAWTGAGTKKSDFLRDSLEFDVKTARYTGRQGYRTCDGYAMATVIDPSIITKEEKAYATVELSGQLTRAQMVVDWSGVLKKDYNVSLIMGLDFAKIQALFRTMI